MSAYVHEAMAEQNFLSGVMARLYRRKLFITLVTLALAFLSFIAIEMLPKSYRAVASVAIEGQTPTAVQAGDVMRDMPFDEQTLGTELAILQSRELLVDTINRTGLENKPEFNPSIRPSWSGQMIANLRQSFSAWLPQEPEMAISTTDKTMADTLDTLRKHIVLAPVPHSRVINITVTARNNELAAQIANTLADLYLSNHLDYRQAASREARRFLETRIGELQDDAARKSNALENFRISHGLNPAMSATLVQEQLSGINTQLQTATAQLALLKGQAQTASRANPEDQAAALGSPSIQKYREQQGILAAERARLAAAYGPESPTLARVNAQLASVQAQIAQEASRYVKSLPIAVAAAQANVDSLTKQLTDLRAQAQTSDEARAKLATLQDDATTARTVYTDYLTRLRNIDASMAYSATNVRVISHAAAAIHPSFPDYLIMWPASFVLSLGVASMVGYMTSRQKGIVGAADIEANYNIAALGMIPFRTRQTEMLFNSSIDQLLNRLLYPKDKTQPPRSILITSALPQEGKTTTSYALAEAAGQRGMKVFLVDADMRSQRMLRPKTVPQIGLGDVLRGTATLDSVTRQTVDGFPMLPAGSPRGNPTRLMALPSLPTVMRQLSMQYDLVIVDAPPALVGGDCEMLVRHVDATIMLAKWDSTPPETIALAIKQLEMERIMGLVLTMVDPHKIMQYDQSDAVIFSPLLARYYGSARN
jgi:succinoglycan biosynthesis transport protein ExoP